MVLSPVHIIELIHVQDEAIKAANIRFNIIASDLPIQPPPKFLPEDILKDSTGDGAVPMGGKLLLTLIMGAGLWRKNLGIASETALLVSFWLPGSRPF